MIDDAETFCYRRSCLQPVYAVQDAECQTVLVIRGPACICPGPCDVGDQDFMVRQFSNLKKMLVNVFITFAGFCC